MDNTFNFKRFGKYFASDLTRLFSENWLKVLCFGLIPVFALILSFMFSLFDPGEYTYIDFDSRVLWLTITTGIFTIWIPSAFYGYVTDRRSGSNYTLIPASCLEKTVSMIINAAVIAPAAFLAIYGVSDLLTTLVAGLPSSNSLMLKMPTWYPIDGFRVYSLVSIHVMTLYFILGAVFFRKGKIAKTILVQFGLGVLLLFIAMTILTRVNEETPEIMYGLDEKAGHALMIIQYAVQMIVLYTLIYFRIKKIQY